ncbi:MAG TPA: tRNA (adenosine(37)-N6)-threonylcarbamoyltransferase complex dimerization subunit type 1 TsaB [Terriglobales bacterium]|nr:tRNA (adenosine(37)-N6)-threonylcarbamoyltransferase complex dimerization subunit type 1 TsaB [Terriglobales bacterium]
MLLLSIDTSGRKGGITLARGESASIEIIASTNLIGGTFSADLIPQIAEVLQTHDHRASELEAIVAVTGPGSFTGLRVGLSAAKALAEALHLKIAAVSSLEALAFIAMSRRKNLSRKVMSLIDAGRGEVYAGIYQQEESSMRKISELLLPSREAIERAQAEDLQMATIDPELASASPEMNLATGKLCEAAARVGWRKLLAGEVTDVLALDANYIRKSEAEYAKAGQSSKTK